MKLKKLEIEEIPSWETDSGKYRGEIEYVGKRGTVKLNLDEKLSDALLLCIGQTVQQFAAQSADELRSSINQSVLEAQKSPVLEG